MAKKTTSAPQPVEETLTLIDMPEVAPKNCTPPVPFERNEFGLYKHVDYKFREDGTVDWRAMVQEEFIVPNKDRTSETDISKLDDAKLLLLLGGFKILSSLRGYNHVHHEVIVSNPDYVGIRTTIEFIGNYETDGRPVSFSALADAHPGNTKSFTRNYLSTIAENRGFVRAVRNFLKIHIVGQDEIGSADLETPSTQASDHLKDIFEKMKASLEARKVTFLQFQNGLIKDEFKGAGDWKSFDSIPRTDWFELSAITKKRLAARDAKEIKEK